MLIVTLYCRLLLSGIHHAYQVRVLLAVETQAGLRCSVPNRTIPYCTVPYRSVETRQKEPLGLISCCSPFCNSFALKQGSTSSQRSIAFPSSSIPPPSFWVIVWQMVRLHGLTKAVRCNYHLWLQLGPQAKTSSHSEQDSLKRLVLRKSLEGKDPADLRTPERDQVDRDMCGHV